MREAVDVSVVVPSYKAPGTLRDCLTSLFAQRFDGSFEVIVSASADSIEELPVFEPNPRLCVITGVPRAWAAVARNRAVAQARGASIAFTDADVVVPPDWLAKLVTASRGEFAVAGSVENGTPVSAVGTAEYLVHFFDFCPARPARTAWHGATCNLFVPRHLWERYGPFPEDMEVCEDTLVTVRLRRAGVLVFRPDATVRHLNRTRLRSILGRQFVIGRGSAILGRRSPHKFRPLVRYTLLAPVAAAGRVISLYARVLAWAPSEFPRALALAPIVVAALAAWGAGLLVEGVRLDIEHLRRRRGRGRSRPSPVSE